MLVIITGASRGIGYSIAERFLKDRKFQIVICCKHKKNLESSLIKLKSKYPKANIAGQNIDLSITKNIKSFANFCLSVGSPFILINNVGSFKSSSIFTENDTDVEKSLSINLFAAYHLTKCLLPKMVENKNGHIINICSIASIKGFKNCSAYNIAKFALYGFGKYLREELKDLNIKVTNVIPGATNTDSWDGMDIDPKRLIDPNDIAEMIYSITKLSKQSLVEDIIIRPQLGDL